MPKGCGSSQVVMTWPELRCEWVNININVDPFTPVILLELKVIRQETSLLE